MNSFIPVINKFTRDITPVFLHLKEKDNNNQWNNFAKAARYLVYVPEPLCALSLFYEISDNYCPKIIFFLLFAELPLISSQAWLKDSDNNFQSLRAKKRTIIGQ